MRSFNFTDLINRNPNIADLMPACKLYASNFKQTLHFFLWKDLSFDRTILMQVHFYSKSIVKISGGDGSSLHLKRLIFTTSTWQPLVNSQIKPRINAESETVEDCRIRWLVKVKELSGICKISERFQQYLKWIFR